MNERKLEGTQEYDDSEINSLYQMLIADSGGKTFACKSIINSILISLLIAVII